MTSEQRKMTLAERIAGFFNRDSKTIQEQAKQIEELESRNALQAESIDTLTDQVNTLKSEQESARASLAEIESVVNAHAHAGQQGTEDDG